MELVTFLSLLLGLVVGEYDIELMVSEQVATVDVLLDSQHVSTLEGPPWRVRCDFGDELQPHLLVAVARNEQGEEMTRAQQWINLPRGQVAASLLLEGDPNDGSKRIVRLSWQSIYGNDPIAMTVNFDGKPLVTGDRKRFALPPHDPFLPHFVTAWLDFGRYGTAVAEVSFGGGFGEQVRAELTAVPVELTRGRTLPEPEGLAGSFVSGGTPLTVQRVEKGESDVVLIMDDASRQFLHELYRDQLDTMQQVLRVDGQYTASMYYDGPTVILGLSEQLWIMASRPRRWQQNKVSYEVFDCSGPYTLESGELSHRLAHLGPDPIPAETQGPDDAPRSDSASPAPRDSLHPAVQGTAGEPWGVRSVNPQVLISKDIELSEGPERVADAVASAGMLAASRGHRRAVVLITSGSGSDASRISVQEARRYLERLHVPLLVWTVDKKQAKGKSAWGKARRIRMTREVAYAFDKLSATLGTQRIVWLDGAHLPQDIELTEQATQFRLAR